MICPLCGEGLKPVVREGIEIDHCPNCQGVWLDKDELDRMVRAEAIRALEQGHEALLQMRRARPYDAAVPEGEDAPMVAEAWETRDGSGFGYAFAFAFGGARAEEIRRN